MMPLPLSTTSYPNLLSQKRISLPRFGEYIRFEDREAANADHVSISTTPKPTTPPRLIASFDYDGTLSAQEEAVHQVLDNSSVPVFTILNTGRILPSLQPMLKKYDPHYLGHIKQLNALVTYQGGELYINHQNLPTLEWLKGLTPEQQDPHWPQYLKESRGWDVSRVNVLMDQMLARVQEMTEASDFEAEVPFKAERYTPYPDFILKPFEKGLKNPPKALIELGLGMAKAFCAECAQYGIQVEPFEEWHSGGSVGFKIVPKGITKASPLEFLLNSEHHPGFEDVDHVMHAGDGHNDVHALTQTHYANKPATGLVCGDDPDVRGAIEDKAKNNSRHSTQHLKFLHELGHSLSEGLHHLLVALEERFK